jgi:hypothetical protein
VQYLYYSTESNCVISREFDAKSFHADLTGRAFLGICETFSVWQKDKSKNATARNKMIFFEQLGYWINVDPVAPSEHIMLSNDTTTAVNTSFKMSGTTVLKSFKIEP